MVQEAYVKLQLAELASIDSPNAWMFKITKHLAIDRIRRQRQEHDHLATSLDEFRTTESGSAASAESMLNTRQECISGLTELIDHLTQTEVVVWLLREIFDWEYQELAALTSNAKSLQALIAAPPIVGRHTRTSASARLPAPARLVVKSATSNSSTLVQVNGHFALAVTLDGVTLCTLPLGPIVSPQDFGSPELV